MRLLRLTSDQPTFKSVMPISHLLLAIVVGIGVGFLGVYASYTDVKWALIVILAVIAPAVILAINDIRKFLLIIFVIDIVLGIDIALLNQGEHRGGPTGYLISLNTIALIIGYALWILERKPKTRFFPQVTIPALVLLFMSLLSISRSPDWQLSLFGFFLRMQVFLMYFYVANHVETPADVRLVVTASIIILSLESIVLILQYIAGFTLNVGDLVTSQAFAEGTGGAGVIGSRVSGTFPDPGSAALYLNSFLPLAFGIYLIGKPVYKGLALTGFSLGLIALVTTSSRAGWISFAVAMAVFLLRLMWTRIGQRALVVALIGALMIGILFGVEIQQRIVTVSTDQTRVQLGATALNVIDASPFGVGDNTYIMNLSNRYLHPDLVGTSEAREQPHNTYLLIWAELGIQGLVALIWLLLAVAWQSKSWLVNTKASIDIIILGTSFLSGFVAHLTHMISESFHGRSETSMLWLIIAMLVVINRFTIQDETVEIFSDGKTAALPLPQSLNKEIR